MLTVYRSTYPKTPFGVPFNLHLPICRDKGPSIHERYQHFLFPSHRAGHPAVSDWRLAFPSPTDPSLPTLLPALLALPTFFHLAPHSTAAAFPPPQSPHWRFPFPFQVISGDFRFCSENTMSTICLTHTYSSLRWNLFHIGFFVFSFWKNVCSLPSSFNEELRRDLMRNLVETQNISHPFTGLLKHSPVLCFDFYL